MLPLVPALLAFLRLAACPPGALVLAPEDTGVDDTGTGDTSTDDTASMGECESGICPLEVSEAWAECGDGAWGDPRVLTATPAGPGALVVVLLHAQSGCCPTVGVVAEAHVRGEPFVEAFVDLSMDDCECECLLDVGFRLDEIPAGTYAVRVMGVETTATVE